MRRFAALSSLLVVLIAGAFVLRSWWSPPARDAAAPVPPAAAEPREVETSITAVARPSELASHERAGVEVARAQEDSAAPAPAASAPASIAVVGRCVDPQSAPIAGVRVTIGEVTCASGDDGRFRCELGSRGEHWLQARRRGYARLQRPIQVPAQGDLDLGDLTLAAGGSIAGRVLDAARRPVAGAEVAAVDQHAQGSIEPHGGPFAPAEQGTSDARGAFLLENVPAGKVLVCAHADDTLWSVSEVLELRPGGALHDIELVLQPIPDADKIELLVQAPDGSPLPRAQIRYSYDAGPISGTGDALADGNGRYLHVVTPQSRAAHDFRVNDPESRFTTGQALGLMPGTRGHVVRLEEPRRMLLRVRDAQDAPVERFALDVLEAGSEHEQLHREQGERQHPEGVLELVVPGESFELRVRAEHHDLGRLGPFDPATAPAEVSVRLAPLPGVRGLVLAAGEPVAGARVTLHQAVGKGHALIVNGDRARYQRHAPVQGVTDAEGRFDLTLRAAGTWYLRAQADALAPADVGPLVLDPKVGAEGLRLELCGGGAIEGRVLVPAGEPEAGLVVGVSRGDSFGVTARTDASGRFRFERLTPGRWHVQQRDSEIVPFSTTSTMSSGVQDEEPPWSCEVRDGATTRFDIDLRNQRTCTLVGRLRLDGVPAAGWIARLSKNGEHSQLRQATLDAEGRFRISVRDPDAETTLLISSPGAGESSFSQTFGFEQDEKLVDHDVPCGRVQGRFTRPTAALHGSASLGELTFQLHLSIDPGASEFRIPMAPAGELSLQGYAPGGDALGLLQVSVRRGEATSRDYP